MRIAIASDLHLGYDWGGERQEDSFEAAMEVVEKASKADMLLLAGDIFDSKMPRQEIIARAFRIFKELKMKKSNAKIVSVKDREGNEKGVNPLAISGFPIIAIYGTHERRARGSTNPVELMEEAGYLVCLHGDVAIVEKDGERVAIHGMSGVPEIYARDVLKEIDPKPLAGMTNVFMLHQSIKGFVYMEEDNPTLTLEDMPDGFDLIINGHIHWANEGKKVKGSEFLIPGSTITTQIRKTESSIPKYIYFYDTERRKLEKEKLSTPRPSYYLEIECDGLSAAEIKEKAMKVISEIDTQKNEKAPLVRLVLKGVVNEATANASYEEIASQFKHKLIVSLAKKLYSEEMMERKGEIVKLMESSSDLGSLMTAIISKNAKDGDISFNAIEVIDLLAEGRIEDAEKLILEELSINKNKGKRNGNNAQIDSKNHVETSKNEHKDADLGRDSKKARSLFDFSSKAPR